MSNFSRRGFIQLAGGAAAVGMAGGFPNIAFGAGHKVVVVGGGYGGAIAAKYLRMADKSIEVTLIEKNEFYYSCPLSNPVIVGARDLEKQQKWGYEGVKKHGITVVHDEVTEIDPAGKKVKTKGGQSFDYDKLVVAPGVEMKYAAIEGYSEEVAEKIPHGWKAGPQTLLLKKQLEAMTDGDPYVIVAPPDPYRCPPGPYERASLVAGYLKAHKPKSKVIILDFKDEFSKAKLFKDGWKELGYNVEHVPAAEGGKVSRVDAAAMTVYTEMAEYKSSAINIIPPQVAGHIAHVAGLVNEAGWCPVDFTTFESKLHKDVHVIGDACAAKPLPKSGYAANSEGKIAAAAIVAAFKGQPVGEPSYVNTCYSLLAPDYGISVAAVYKLDGGEIKTLNPDGKPAVSAHGASRAVRKQEALYAESWYQNVMQDAMG